MKADLAFFENQAVEAYIMQTKYAPIFIPQAHHNSMNTLMRSSVQCVQKTSYYQKKIGSTVSKAPDRFKSRTTAIFPASITKGTSLKTFKRAVSVQYGYLNSDLNFLPIVIV